MQTLYKIMTIIFIRITKAKQSSCILEMIKKNILFFLFKKEKMKEKRRNTEWDWEGLEGGTKKGKKEEGKRLYSAFFHLNG